jgi:hypothetical protein
MRGGEGLQMWMISPGGSWDGHLAARRPAVITGTRSSVLRRQARTNRTAPKLMRAKGAGYREYVLPITQYVHTETRITFSARSGRAASDAIVVKEAERDIAITC